VLKIIYRIKKYKTMKKEMKFDPTWEVPKAEYNELAPKKTKYCVIIPVINEGERIFKELTSMKEHGIPQAADIIITDAGSTDGSLEEDFLNSIGVRALLVKKDTGRQGAQLRIAFAYALTEGYEGIITIDGNNKDGVEAIHDFIKALDDGYDFVQGSRYVPGGKAVNTPFARHWAVKLIHVPVVSLNARFKFTDTTNAFRAYSRKYLLHPDVQPFRNIFQTYELLAYLSVRASRLGLKVKETPVSRSYPKKGKTPTKISFFKGNSKLISILKDLSLGKYNPK
jgi:dolichol-phosphate mannosyltransferase